MNVANCRKIDLKRKTYSRGKTGRSFKRFKRLPKYAKENLENKIAREKEKDEYHFTDSESDDGNDLGMGLELSDLTLLLDEAISAETKQKELIALTQDSVRPLFTQNSDCDERKLEEGLAELNYKSFRPNQKETIVRILSGRSTLFISPTGSGKSLCYQLPALLYWRYRKYMTIVVSPLISLMEDQLSNFPQALKAVSLHSGQTRVQRRRCIDQLVNGDAQVLFISPEAIVGGFITPDDLKSLPPVGFVCIDEAHCLSEWSHNFRPAYLQFFKILQEQMCIKTYLGLTATATKGTSFTIAKNLVINPETDVIGSTTVPENLILSVSYETDKEKALIELLKSLTFVKLPSIIVYCNRREETEKVASRIRTAMQHCSSIIEMPERKKRSPPVAHEASGLGNIDDVPLDEGKAHMKLTWHAEAYHAGLSSDTRKRIQRQFIKGEIRVVVATVAFGMGINKANVRAIIHYDMPGSFENYLQEIGRAGRDGKPAQCHMFLTPDKTDMYYQQRNIYATIPEPKNLKKLISFLFKKCRCTQLASKSDLDKLEKLNEADQHRITRNYRTKFTDVAISPIEDHDDEISDGDDEINDKENPVVKYTRKSVVKKHRICKGHEVAFDVEKASMELNLRPESIMTLIYQLQEVYPQLQIKQFNPIRSKCRLLCYRGPSQLQSLVQNSTAIRAAFRLYKMEQLKSGGFTDENPDKLSFDVVNLASFIDTPTADVMRMLRRTEWELADNTGKFRRSQVRVKFEGNSFHLKTIGDLNKEEMDEIHEFLLDYTRLYEVVATNKIAELFYTVRRYSLPMTKMVDRITRLETSLKLKTVLNTYFNSPPKQQLQVNVDIKDPILGSLEDASAERFKHLEPAIRKNARAFISAHGKDHNSRTIARIFQGISTPNYPAETWGTNRKWWRIHLDVSFNKLASIISEELCR